MIRKFIQRYLPGRVKRFLLSDQDIEILTKHKQNSCFLPGHFYSPIVDVQSVRSNENEIWPPNPKLPANIDLNEYEQLELLKQFEQTFKDFPYLGSSMQGLRYNLVNNFFDPLDAVVLYSFIRNRKPNKIIEVGSGFSSAVILDTNELFCNKTIHLTFIEPYPERLKSLLRTNDEQGCTILEKGLQEIPLKVFSLLDENDILFIDSTHVCKTGSDLNYLFFQVLPVLNKGVIIHFHDILYPFEYHKRWVFEGRNWNESYFLRAFLMYNNDFKIIFFNDYLFKYQNEKLKKSFPLENLSSGGSIYLIKN